MTYDEAVEEALCYGWIDSIVRSLDDTRYAQKFTPRKDHAKWSDSNKHRLRALLDAGRMTPAGLARVIPAVLAEVQGDLAPIQPRTRIDVPDYITEALRADDKAWEFFSSLAPSHRSNVVRWIDSARRDDTRRRRLEEARALFARGEKLGLK